MQGVRYAGFDIDPPKLQGLPARGISFCSEGCELALPVVVLIIASILGSTVLALLLGATLGRVSARADEDSERLARELLSLRAGAPLVRAQRIAAEPSAHHEGALHAGFAVPGHAAEELVRTGP
jgi:hypothetical protein